MVKKEERFFVRDVERESSELCTGIAPIVLHTRKSRRSFHSCVPPFVNRLEIE